MLCLHLMHHQCLFLKYSFGCSFHFKLYDFIIQANITSCKNTVLPIIDSMRKRRRGQICIFASVAGLGMNFISPMYSACKMSVFAFAECTSSLFILNFSITLYAILLWCICQCCLSWFDILLRFTSRLYRYSYFRYKYW